MSEQRLVEANKYKECLLSGYTAAITEDDDRAAAAYEDALGCLDTAPSIDLETLPIVRELREKLCKAERELKTLEENYSSAANDSWNNRKKLSVYEKAEKEGRMIDLPCKVGDKVIIYAESWGNVWNYNTFYRNGKHYVSGEIVAIIKTKKQLLMKVRAYHNVSWKRPMKRYPVSALGKTVFLNSEATMKEGE